MSNARFAILQSSAVSDERLTNAQFRTLAALGTFGDKDGWCWPKLKTLGSLLGKSPQAVSRDIKALEGLGYIQKYAQKREDGAQINNKYRLVFDPPPQRDVEAPSTSDVEAPSTSDVEAPSTSDVEALTYQYNGKQFNEPNKNTAPARPEPEPNQYEGISGKEQNRIRGDLEEHFSHLTKLGLPSRRTQRDKRRAGFLWWSPLRKIAELVGWREQDAKDLITASVARLEESNLTISSPNSILNTAEAIVAEVKRGSYQAAGMSSADREISEYLRANPEVAAEIAEEVGFGG